MKKKAVTLLSLVILGALVVCTLVSTVIYDRSLPTVTPLSPIRAQVNSEEYPMVVPADCVYRDDQGTFVYRVKQTSEGWKTERCTVRIEATDGSLSAIRRVVSEEILVAWEPSAPLSDGQTVKLRESPKDP